MGRTKEDLGNESTDLNHESRRGEQRNQAMQTRRGHEMQRPISPFGFMRRFNEEMDRLFRDLSFGGGSSETSGREMGMFGDRGLALWSPQIEVFEHKGELCVRADLPGMTKDEIEVDITGNTLVLRGERRSEHEEEDDEQGYYRTERSYGSFYRTILLPEGVDAENAEANFSNGVLEITMPAPERGERRRLEIGDGEQQRPRTHTKAAGQR
jgi:HSP20 family protein